MGKHKHQGGDADECYWRRSPRHSASPSLHFLPSSAGGKRDKYPGMEFSFVSPNTHLFFAEFSFKFTNNKCLDICKTTFPMHSLHRETWILQFPKNSLRCLWPSKCEGITPARALTETSKDYWTVHVSPFIRPSSIQQTLLSSGRSLVPS